MASDTKTLNNKVEELYHEGQFGKIISLLTDEVLDKHKDAALYLWRGNSWHTKGEYDKAIADYNKAIELKPEYVSAYYNRGNSWHTKGEYDKAIADYNKVIELKPDYASAYHNRGISWHPKGEYDKAIANYNKAIELKPDYASAYYNRGISWENKDEYDKAIGDYNKAIELKPDDADAYYIRGISWQNQDEYEKAITDYNKVIELKPDDADAYNNRGLLWENKDEHDKAIADYNKAIGLKPDDADAYYNRGISWDNKNEYDKAIGDYNKAIELKPDSADAYYNRGISWQNKGEYDKAIADYGKYLELTPYKTDVWAKRAKSNIVELLKLQGDKKLKEIDSIIKGIKKFLSFNSGCVTHYTGLTVAKFLILESSPFRISEGAFLNDTSEGRELFKFLDLKFTPEKGTDDTVAEPFAQKPFIGSFVEETKHDDLNLWRMYGKENKEEARGCALTIKADKFVEGINEALASGGDKPRNAGKMTAGSDDINFYRVAYRRNDKPDEFFVPELKPADMKKVNKLLKDLKANVMGYNPTTGNKKDLEEAINSIAFLFKSDVYRSENELRLVVKGVGFEKKMDKNVTPPKVYIDLVNVRPMVEQITLGPKVERPDEWAAALFYSYDKEDNKPKILISHLPFK